MKVKSKKTKFMVNTLLEKGYWNIKYAKEITGDEPVGKLTHFGIMRILAAMSLDATNHVPDTYDIIELAQSLNLDISSDHPIYDLSLFRDSICTKTVSIDIDHILQWVVSNMSESVKKEWDKICKNT